MIIYLDEKSFNNFDVLKNEYKFLEDSEVKSLNQNIKKHMAEDLDNIYARFCVGNTINFYIRSPQQISFLAKQIAKDFQYHEKTLRLSLSELMMNSLEHGNLRIDSSTKNDMISDGSYYDLLSDLIKSNEKQYIKVEYKIDYPKQIVIKDQGSGFNFKDYLSRHNMQENDAYSGRGIQIASVELPKNKATFSYAENGNTLIIDFA
jgi:hypothetical protein